jgi:hypothetical protein
VTIKVSLFGTAAGAAGGVAFWTHLTNLTNRAGAFLAPPASSQDFLDPPPELRAALEERFLGITLSQVEELTGFRQGRCSLNLHRSK